MKPKTEAPTGVPASTPRAKPNDSSRATGEVPPISRCATRIVTRTSERPQWNPRTRWSQKNVVLVRLELEDGTPGIGEAYCDGGAPESVVGLIEHDLAPRLMGRSPLDTRRHWHDMVDTSVVSAKGGAIWAALSALDIAVWDLAGRVLGQPVHRLLGGTRDRVPAYASAGLYGEGKTLDDLASEMAGYVAKGFRAVKLKVGGETIAQDVLRVAAVRDAIGPDVDLMVDALYSYTDEEALRLARKLEPLNIRFLEAPVHPGNVEGLRRVCAQSPIPVAGNEFAYGIDAFRQLIVDAGVQYVHADAILCGGITGALRVADLAHAFHRPISFHAASSAVCLAANAHVAMATCNADSVEFHMIHQVLFEEARRLPFSLADGDLVLDETPGLGLDIGTW